MQPLARSHISPVFKWPTVLPQARPQGEVCAAAGGSRSFEKFKWRKRVTKQCKLVLRNTVATWGYMNMTTDASVIRQIVLSHKWNVINH